MHPATLAGFVSELGALAKVAELKRSIHLQGHQEDAVRRSHDSAGMILNWGLGSGKTIGSMAIAEEKGGNVLVVVPAALRENYKKQLASTVQATRHKAYTIISYDAFRKDPERWIHAVKPTTVIADEFHRLRNPRPREPFEKVRGQVPYMLGLTGSLVNNRPEEIVPLTNLIAGKQVFKSEEDFDRKFIGEQKVGPGLWARLRGVKPGIREGVQNESVLGRILAPFVHRFAGDPEYQKHVPQVNERRVEVEMSPRQEEMLKSLSMSNPRLDYKIRHNLPPSKAELKNMNAFMTGSRQISNNPQAFSTKPTPSPKLEKMFEDIHADASKDPNFKAVVYSNFIESGIGPLVDTLKSKGISAESFTGGLNDKQRQMLVDKFNKGQIRVLGLSPAGGEGLDLKGVKLVQLTEEHWNPERTRQAIGRSARFKSHDALPESERKVQVNRYLAVHPPPGFFSKLFGGKRPMSPDEWIDARRQEKLRLNQAVVNSIPQYHGQRKAASVTMMAAFGDELLKLAVSKAMVGRAIMDRISKTGPASKVKKLLTGLFTPIKGLDRIPSIFGTAAKAGKEDLESIRHTQFTNPLPGRVKETVRGVGEPTRVKRASEAFMDELSKLAKNISRHHVTDVDGLSEYRTDRIEKSKAIPTSKTKAIVVGGLLGAIPGGVLGHDLGRILTKTKPGHAALLAAGLLGGGGIGIGLSHLWRENQKGEIARAKKEVGSKGFKKDTHKMFTQPLHKALRGHMEEKERLEGEIEDLRSEIDDLSWKQASAFMDELAKLAISETKIVGAIFHHAYAGKQVGPTINRMAKNYVATSRTMGSPLTREGLKKWIGQVRETGKV